MMLITKIDGTFCLSQVVPDSKNKTIWITSARIEKADGVSSARMTDKLSNGTTSETLLDVPSAPTDIVPQTEPDVNGDLSGGTETKTSIDRAEIEEKYRGVLVGVSEGEAHIMSEITITVVDDIMSGNMTPVLTSSNTCDIIIKSLQF